MIEHDPQALLAIRIGHGDKKAENEFCGKYHGSIMKLLGRYTTNRTLAEDITQNALLTVLIRLRDEGIKSPESLGSYVLQTAKFIYLGWWRSADNKHRNNQADDEIEMTTEVAADENTVQQLLLAQQRQKLVHKIIGGMKIDRDRELLQRVYTYDEPKDSICESLQLSSIHFERVMHRARKRFQHLVNEQPTEVRLALNG